MTFVYAYLLECRDKVQRLPRPIISDPHRVSELQRCLSAAQCVCERGTNVRACVCMCVLVYIIIKDGDLTQLNYNTPCMKNFPFTCSRLQRDFVPLVKCYCFCKVEFNGSKNKLVDNYDPFALKLNWKQIQVHKRKHS